MFFKVCHSESSSSLLGVVSSDGSIYYKASDVAKLLNYPNPRRFALREANLRIKDVVFGKLKFSVATTWIFSSRDTVNMLKKSKRTREFGTLLAEGEKTSTYSLQDDWTPTRKAKEAVVVPISQRAEDDDICPTFEDIASEIVRKTLEMYKETQQMASEMHYYGPELETLKITGPPEILKMHFGNEIFSYKLEDC